MSSKNSFFYIYNLIVSIFIISSSLFFYHYLTILFDKYLYVGIFVTFFGVLINLALFKHLLKIMLKSEENLDKKIKQTLHELNIPASTIQINTQMLQKSLNDDQKSQDRLERIDKATKQLLTLYNKMEYEIKKEIDKIEYKEFELDNLVQNSILKFDDIKKDIRINCSIEKVILYGDKDGFEVVVDNLLANAIKYNISGGLVDISYKKGYLNIFNSGEKIDTKSIFLIFEQYYQINSQNKGFGLGLHIVKEYCDKNFIDIKISSNEEGTTFMLNLLKLIKN